MTRRLSVRATAEAEIEEAYAWYSERGIRLGQRFLAEVRKGLAAIEKAPERYPVIRGRVRSRLLNHFPYSLLYLAEGDRVVVLACFHARRDPRQWHSRT